MRQHEQQTEKQARGRLTEHEGKHCVSGRKRGALMQGAPPDQIEGKYPEDLFGNLCCRRRRCLFLPIKVSADTGMSCGKRHRERQNAQQRDAACLLQDLRGEKGCQPEQNCGKAECQKKRWEQTCQKNVFSDGKRLPDMGGSQTGDGGAEPAAADRKAQSRQRKHELVDAKLFSTEHAGQK